MNTKFKLVPVEPTPEMFHAGQTAVSGFPRDVLERWQAMLTAAPQQEPEVVKLVEALEGLLAIVDESDGVSGYHLNGDIAKWCEFEEVAMAEEALESYRQQGGEA